MSVAGKDGIEVIFLHTFKDSKIGRMRNANCNVAFARFSCNE
jgi:hypothetical protein